MGLTGAYDNNGSGPNRRDKEVGAGIGQRATGQNDRSSESGGLTESQDLILDFFQYGFDGTYAFLGAKVEYLDKHAARALSFTAGRIGAVLELPGMIAGDNPVREGISFVGGFAGGTLGGLLGGFGGPYGVAAGAVGGGLVGSHAAEWTYDNWDYVRDEVIGVGQAETIGEIIAPPIVLDLDADGLDLVGHEASSVFFDWDGDGFVEKTGWAGADDGILVYDHDGDGKVTQADEISFVGYLTGARTDLEGLRFFDTNTDGRLDAADAEAARFKVWQDRDQDGEVDAGEMTALAEAGIAAIGLHGQAVDRTADGNTVFNEATFTRTDGATGTVGDVAFTYQTRDFQRAVVTDAAPAVAAARPSDADRVRAALAAAGPSLRQAPAADPAGDDEDRRLARLAQAGQPVAVAAPAAELLTLAALGAVVAAPRQAAAAPLAVATGPARSSAV